MIIIVVVWISFFYNCLPSQNSAAMKNLFFSFILLSGTHFMVVLADVYICKLDRMDILQTGPDAGDTEEWRSTGGIFEGRTNTCGKGTLQYSDMHIRCSPPDKRDSDVPFHECKILGTTAELCVPAVNHQITVAAATRTTTTTTQNNNTANITTASNWTVDSESMLNVTNTSIASNVKWAVDAFKVHIKLTVYEVNGIWSNNCGPFWDMEVDLNATTMLPAARMSGGNDDAAISSEFEQGFVKSRCGRRGSLVIKCSPESGSCDSRGFQTCN